MTSCENNYNDDECPICYQKFPKKTESLSEEQMSCMYFAANNSDNWSKINGSSTLILDVNPKKLYSDESVMSKIKSCEVKFKNIAQVEETFGLNTMGVIQNAKVIDKKENEISLRVGICKHVVCETCEEGLRENKCPMCRKENFLQPFFQKQHVITYNYNSDFSQNSVNITTYTFTQLLETSGIVYGNNQPINSASSSPMRDEDYDDDHFHNEDHFRNGTFDSRMGMYMDYDYESDTSEIIRERREREYAGDYGETYNEDEDEDEDDSQYTY